MKRCSKSIERLTIPSSSQNALISKFNNGLEPTLIYLRDHSFTPLRVVLNVPQPLRRSTVNSSMTLISKPGVDLVPLRSVQEATKLDTHGIPKCKFSKASRYILQTEHLLFTRLLSNNFIADKYNCVSSHLLRCSSSVQHVSINSEHLITLLENAKMTSVASPETLQLPRFPNINHAGGNNLEWQHFSRRSFNDPSKSDARSVFVRAAAVLPKMRNCLENDNSKTMHFPCS